MNVPRTYALKARYLLPVDSPPIADGLLTVAGHRIEVVAPASASLLPPGCPTLDLGNVAILPGLVNAHTHLEFSDLAEPLGTPGMSLPAWIRLVMQHRSVTPDDAAVTSAIVQGLRESIATGTTSLGEIATRDWPVDPPGAPPIELTVFRELISASDDVERISACLATAKRHLASGNESDSWRPGLSPHAPYSVHPQLWQSLLEVRSGDPSSPLAIHLAESPEEIEWLQSGAGPFAELLSDLGVAASSHPPRRPLEFISSLPPTTKALFVHGNYLDAEEIARLAESSATASVVYCPRTQSFFQHQPYPLAAMLSAGVNVALGTDGRCSNPDLSVLSEMRHVAAKHPEVPLTDVLAMGTLRGARALGYDDSTGSLTAGKDANLAVVALPDSTDDPHSLLLHAEGQVQATVYRGKLIHAATDALAANWATL